MSKRKIRPYKTFFTVGLDDVTVARLMELADCTDARPETLIASIVRDVLEDDARQHGEANVTQLQLQ